MSPESVVRPDGRQYTVRAYNQRMAGRVARRAHVEGEGAVTVAFAFNNLATMIIFGVIRDTVKFVYHTVLFIRRARYIAQEANLA